MDFLEENIKQGIAEQATPGVAYSVITGDQVVTGAVGSKTYANPEDKVTAQSLYDIASLTKVLVVVTLVSKLIDRGVIKPNDPLKKYLPRFKYDDVTINSLLCHMSGLPADLVGKEIVSRDEILDQVYAAEKEYETGTKIVYSDLGFILLGEMISQIYGKPLNEVAEEEIFKPLKMTSTGYLPTDKKSCVPTEQTESRGLVCGVVHDEKACSLGGVAGNAGVFTNAHDLTNFVSMVLNNGVFEGKQFLSKEIIDLWFEPMVREQNERTDRLRSWCWIVGYNRLVSEKNRNMISFNGFTGPSISIDREKGLGIVLLANRVHPTRDNTKYTAVRKTLTDSIYRELKLDEPTR